MSLFYSARTGGFYTSEIHGAATPDDAVEVTSDRHRELMSAQARGAVIVPTPNGHPRARFPEIEERRQILISTTRAEASRRIRAFSPEWRQINDLRDPTPAGARRFEAIDAIRCACGRIEAEIAAASATELSEIAVKDHADWPQFETGKAT